MKIGINKNIYEYMKQQFYADEKRLGINYEALVVESLKEVFGMEEECTLQVV